MLTTPKPINWKAYLAYFAAMRLHGVRYQYGGKLPKLSTPPSEAPNLDCSGYMRGNIYHSAGGTVIPDGSQNQLDWCMARLEEVPYGAATNDFIIAFMKPFTNGVGGVGHVWNVKDGMTYECHGRTTGIDSRPWDHASLKDHVYKAFRWPLAAIGTFALHQSNGDLMAKLLLFNRRAYVSARGQWQVWFPNTKVDWDAKKAVISINEFPTSTNRIINGEGYVLFTEAAEITGLTYLVNNNAREINLLTPTGAK